MTPEQWRRLDELFDEAGALPAVERAAFVESRCADDSIVRNELLSLLEVAPNATSFLETPAIFQDIDQLIGQAETLRDPLLGRMIDRFRVTSRIGHDEDGIVYLARDEQGNDARLRVMTIGAGAVASNAARLESRDVRENGSWAPRELARGEFAMAGARHNFIAWESKSTTPLCEYARQRNCRLRERVELFARAAKALQEMHDAGAAHGRLSSSRIGVRNDGKIEFADIGLPTKRNADPAETLFAADVRAAGVALFELLTDRVAPGGTAPSLRQVDARFDAELDAIVAMCVRPAAERCSATELSVALERRVRHGGSDRAALSFRLGWRGVTWGAAIVVFLAIAAYGMWKSLF